MSGQNYATPDDWCILLPEFGTANPAYLQVWLDATKDAINLQCWGGKACTAHIFMAAHMLTVVQPAGEGAGEVGPVKERQIDKLRVQYGKVGTSDALDPHFNSTKYGRNLLALRSTLLVIGIVARRRLNPLPFVC